MTGVFIRRRETQGELPRESRAGRCLYKSRVSQKIKDRIFPENRRWLSPTAPVSWARSLQSSPPGRGALLQRLLVTNTLRLLLSTLCIPCRQHRGTTVLTSRASWHQKISSVLTQTTELDLENVEQGRGP